MPAAMYAIGEKKKHSRHLCPLFKQNRSGEGSKSGEDGVEGGVGEEGIRSLSQLPSLRPKM